MKEKTEDQNLSFGELAKQLGVSVEKIIQIAMKEGLINVDGSPTQKAIDNGLLIESIQNTTSTNDAINLN